MPAGLPIPIVAMLGWPEVIGLLVIVLILFGARKLPDLAQRLGRGLDEFRQATKDAQADLDRATEEAGQSAAGIHGKPALEGLTHNNQVAEFYSLPKRDDSTSARMKFSDKLTVFVAQGFGIGRIPFAPGTWGTLLGMGWMMAVWHLMTTSGGALTAYAALTLSIPISTWICARAEQVLNENDPGSIVLDEIVALPFAFIIYFLNFKIAPGVEHFATPVGMIALAVGFTLFRFFDIWKPWPVRQSQSLPGGWGVVMDDVLAAVYVNLVALALFAVANFIR